jgi:hypothetical protein
VLAFKKVCNCQHEHAVSVHGGRGLGSGHAWWGASFTRRVTAWLVRGGLLQIHGGRVDSRRC